MTPTRNGHRSCGPAPPLRAGAVLLLALAGVSPAAAGSPVVPLAQTFTSPLASDQDDMCVWVHPTDPAQSVIVASDKAAGQVFVYDIAGSVLQSFVSPWPGNVDVRYGFPLGGECVDIVAFNERGEQAIRVYRVDPSTRTLVRVDDGAIVTGLNYGFTLHRPPGGELHAITGPKTGLLKQYRLFEGAGGTVSGVATGWQFHESTVEGMVGDDETGWVYLSEEEVGIWRVSASDDTDATLIAEVDDGSGLAAQVEGIALFYAAGGDGFLVASSQGVSKLTVFRRAPPHDPLGDFRLDGVGSTDGVDVLNLPLDATFAEGILVAHNGQDPATLAAVRWADVAAALPAVVTDTTYWDPRGCPDVVTSPAPFPPSARQLVLHAARPNPASPDTRLRFTLREGAFVRVVVHDPRGRALVTLAEGFRAAGTHAIDWAATVADGRPLPAGVYFCRVDAGGERASVKVVVAR